MSQVVKLTLAAALLSASASASAWWGNSSDWFGDALGDFDFSFNMNFSARGDGYAQDYADYYSRPYYGYGPYNPAPYGAPAIAASPDSQNHPTF